MSFFSEDRMAELRELFVESTQELLQTLNDEAMQLEKRPGDPQIVRELRRVLHTIKGDSASVGYRQLSELAHEVEEVLTPELAACANAAIADLVLAAADVFHAMIQAYCGNMQPPSAEALRQQIGSLLQAAAPEPKREFRPSFAWSEYEQVLLVETAARGGSVYNIAVLIDRECPVPAAAAQVIRGTLRGCGNVLVIHPKDDTPAEKIDAIEAAIATAHDQAWLENKLNIPAAAAKVIVEKYVMPAVKRPPNQALASDEFASAEDASASLAPESSPVAFPSGRKPLAAPAMPAARRENILRVDAERIDVVLNLVGELIIVKSMLLQCMAEFSRRFPKDPLRGRLTDAMGQQSRVMTDLQKSVMKIRMVPVEQLFRRLPRVVRDVAKSCGKQVSLSISGEHTDLDKSILDQLAEPLTHLVRNAVDHGIESAEQRAAAGKPAEGGVRLNAYHQAHQIIIEVSDDGRGIDRKRVIAKAIERGLITQADADRLSESEALELIFQPGFSTAEQVTQISGRGVGLDVVRATMERLKGSVSINTVLGKGTTFFLKVPLTLAIINALLFQADERLYAVPLASVSEISRNTQPEFHCLAGYEVMQLREEVLPVVRLSHKPQSTNKSFVLVIAVADRKFGLVVNKLVGEEELVIKALDDPLIASELVSGASILGDGTVVLILNVSAVIQRLGRLQPAGAIA